MKSIEIDRGKRLRDHPTTGHNRFHPDIPPLVAMDEGEVWPRVTPATVSCGGSDLNQLPDEHSTGVARRVTITSHGDGLWIATLLPPSRLSSPCWLSL